MTTRIEAEAWTLVRGFTVETTNAASGGARIKGNGLSTARHTHALADGLYSITVAYWDESDGQSSFEFRVDGTIVDAWIWNADPDSTTGNASSAALMARTINDVAIRNGSLLEIEGTAHLNEGLRVDYLDFTYSGALPPAGKLNARLKRWDGAAWVAPRIMVRTATGWVEKPLKRWDGAAWVST